MKFYPAAKSVCSIALPAFLVGWLVGGQGPCVKSHAQRSGPALVVPRSESLADAGQSAASNGNQRIASATGVDTIETPNVPGTPSEFASELDPARRHAMLRRMMASTAPDGWAVLAQDLDPWIKPFERQFMLATWAGVDAREAIRYVKERETVTKDEDLKVIADIWAASNPHDVLAAIRDEPERTAGFGRAAVLALAERDVASAAQALALIKPEEAGEIAEAVVARLDPQSIEQLMQRVGPSTDWSAVRTAGYSSLAQGKVSTVSSSELRAWAAAHLGDDAFVSGGLPKIASSLERSEALSWLSGLPIQHGARENVVMDVYSRWLEDDSMGATAWLLAHREIPDHDQAAAHVANAIALEDPAGASAWAATILDSDMRQGLLDSLDTSASVSR